MAGPRDPAVLGDDISPAPGHRSYPSPLTERPTRLRRVTPWVLLGLVVLVVAGWLVVAVTGPPTIPGSRNPLPLSVAGGCPSGQSVHDHDGVDNSRPTHGRLLPAGLPTAALVCRYQGDGTPPRILPALAQSARLDAARAGTLALAIRALTLTRGFGGPVSCPNDEVDAAIYLVFHYAQGPDAGLHYRSTGCQTLDNGRIITSIMGNDSFGDYQQALAATAGMDSSGQHSGPLSRSVIVLPGGPRIGR